MTSSCKITTLAFLIAYALFCFSVPPSTSATPNLRGGIPSLYMKVAVGETFGVRGGAPAVAPTSGSSVLVINKMLTVGMEPGASAAAESDMGKFEQDDESSCTRTSFEVLAVLVSIIALVLRTPQSRSPTRMTITVSAIFIAYVLFSFGVPPSMSATPHVRGGIPSLYMQPALRHVSGVRGSAVVEMANEVAKLDQEVTWGAESDMGKFEQDDESSCTRTSFEVLAVLVSIIALVLRIPQSRSPTCMTITVSAIFIAYVLFSFGVPPSMSATPHVRGGIPSLYMQPALRHAGGVRGSAVAEMANEAAKLDQEVASLGTYAVAEVLAFLMSIMALAQRIPQSRSHTRVMITVSAILVAYTLFSFSIPRTMNVTPHVRGAIPSLYVQPVFNANSGLRGAAVPSTLNGMNTVEQDEAYYEAYQSLPDLKDTLSENFGPMGYWAALSMPAMAMTYLTQRKEHSKLH